jgi:class 3 adenylate cyclase/tetratricopeptide (TPR) repeat protein
VDFVTVVDQAIALLRQRGRLTYRTLQLQFQLDDTHLQALTDELIKGQRLAVDEEGAVLVWTGDTATSGSPASPASVPASPPAAASPPEAERRQLTVLFCDLVDSTRLARRFDPEDWREMVRAYQAACATVIQRFDGSIAQYLGDGLLVYFGYPQAHEDDARRAVHTGLAMLEAMRQLNVRLEREQHVQLAVRVGIHTGLVVVGEMGGGGRHEHLALGDTPNLAARLQGLAAPDTVVVSADTVRLVEGYVRYKDLGTQAFKGVDTPVAVYHVVGEGTAQSRLEVTAPHGWTPLVGREAEVALLRERWAQVTEGLGQVILVQGEAGIGKSRLVQVLKEHVAEAPHAALECRGSPYHQHSALYPVIDLIQRAWQLAPGETPLEHLHTLEAVLAPSRLPVAQTVPLLAALLSLPLPPDRYAPLSLTPQQQKQQTLDALLGWLLALAAQQPVLLIVEDLHWIDPSTLEWVSLLLDQVPTTRLGLLMTARPDFPVPWGARAYFAQLTPGRFARPQVQQMVEGVTGGKRLPAEVMQQIVAKADGVPLFVEELTKAVLEASWLQAQEDHYDLTGPLPPLAIPATLQDALMARLDRLAEGKAVAQLGAVLGRTFPHALLQTVAPLDELAVWRGLGQLVEAEVLYQQGGPPQATYTFKHALLQDAAYQSLLRSTRQQYHQRTAHVLVEQFPDLVETQPELVAHHSTEAGLGALAVEYWQRAGERVRRYAGEREAIAHYRKGLDVLQTLPVTPMRAQHELDMLVYLIEVLHNTEGPASPKFGPLMAQARVLCQQTGDTPHLFWVLFYLRGGYAMRGEHQTAREVAEQALALAQRLQEPALFVSAHYSLGNALMCLGDLTSARSHFEQALAYDDTQQRTFRSWAHTVLSLSRVACLLWLLGYPDQALQRNHEAFVVVQQWSNPHHTYATLVHASTLHLFRREVSAVHERTEAALALAAEQGTRRHLPSMMHYRGWVLTAQGHSEEGIAQMRQSLEVMQATGEILGKPLLLALLAEAYGQSGQAEEGLRLLAEALAEMDTTGERDNEAELYRIQGELLVQQAVPDALQAEVCFQQALAVARRQEAKSLELRAAVSLSQLWQQQSKRAEAYELLAPIYGWFTEGFETADLQDAKALLEELAG